MNRPTITVIMPVFNSASFIKEAVASILNQSFPDFEFVIIDDGSTDGSREAVEQFKDDRIRLIPRGHCGLTEALNLGLHIAGADWIARMDADDVALPDRLSVQWDYVRRKPEVVALGGRAIHIDELGRKLGTCEKSPCGHHQLLRHLEKPVTGSTLVHSTVLMRKASVIASGGYRPDFVCAEDKDLWLRLSLSGRLHSLPDIVLLLRKHSKSVSAIRERLQVISGNAAISCHLVRKKTGVDIVAHDREVFDLCMEKMGQLVDLHGIVAVRNLRRDLAEAARTMSIRRMLSLTRSASIRQMYRAIFLPNIYRAAISTVVAELLRAMEGKTRVKE